MLDYELIGERIRKARIKNNMTQEMLSEKMNVSTEYCSKIECGKAKINLKRLSQISTILNEKIEYLMAGATVQSKNYLREDLAKVVNTLSGSKVNALLEIAKILEKIDN